MPSRAKGRRYPVEISCVAWMDLLGYGRMLAAVGFDPSRAQAQEAVARLEAFQRSAAAAADRVFPAMPINDGVAYFKDLSPRARSVTADFLYRAVCAYQSVNEVDRANGYPGARMVIAAGPRLRIGGVIRLSDSHMKSISERRALADITTEQTINEAFRSSPIAGFVPQLQANFAFTRAYLADEGGSEVGLGGPKCYIDLALFDNPEPSWIHFARKQAWESRGLRVVFGELEHIDWGAVGKSKHAGIRNSLEIAAALEINYANERPKRWNSAG